MNKFCTDIQNYADETDYLLYFKTDNHLNYKIMQSMARRCVDGTAYASWGKPYFNGDTWAVTCSACLYGTAIRYKEFRPGYCSNCGAKMDENWEVENNE